MTRLLLALGITLALAGPALAQSGAISGDDFTNKRLLVLFRRGGRLRRGAGHLHFAHSTISVPVMVG